MRRGVVAALAGVLAISALGLLAGPAAAASQSDWMYEPTTFTEIRLSLPQASYELLEDKEYDEYVEGTFELAETDGAPSQVGTFGAPITVGIKLKGGIGSRRSINEKAGLKLSFGKFVKGQTFAGLEKMTLNNMVQDPSMTHEVLAYSAFHQMGVFAPNTGFAYVWVNGKSYGLHLNLETPDKIALEKRFGPFQNPPQHLYEGEYGADVSSGINPYDGKVRWEDLEVDEGKSKEKGDLAALLAAVEGTTGSFTERVGPHADLAEMTRMWMTERYIGHWDGYSGDIANHFLPNNYYLYSDPAGVFQLFPWGTDQTWEEPVDFGTPAGALFEGCMGDPACAALYLEAGEEATTKLDATRLDALAADTAAAVRPWREYEIAESEAAMLPPYDLQETLDAQDAVRQFIAERPAELAAFLPARPADPQGQEPSAQEPSAQVPSGDEAGQGSSAPPSAPSSPSSPQPPVLRHQAIRANAVGLELRADVPGRVTLLGSFRTPSGTATACRGSAEVAGAGIATVGCRFTAAFRRRLEDGAAYMRLTATIEPAGGAPQSSTRTIRVPRR